MFIFPTICNDTPRTWQTYSLPHQYLLGTVHLTRTCQKATNLVPSHPNRSQNSLHQPPVYIAQEATPIHDILKSQLIIRFTLSISSCNFIPAMTNLLWSNARWTYTNCLCVPRHKYLGHSHLAYLMGPCYAMSSHCIHPNKDKQSFGHKNNSICELSFQWTLCVKNLAHAN